MSLISPDRNRVNKLELELLALMDEQPESNGDLCYEEILVYANMAGYTKEEAYQAATNMGRGPRVSLKGD